MKTETRRAVLVAIALFVILLTAGAIATVAETRDLLRPGPHHDSRTDPLRLQSSQTPPSFRYELASDGRPTGRFVFQDFFVPVAWTGSAERPPVALGSAQDFFSDAIRIVGGAVFAT